MRRIYLTFAACMGIAIGVAMVARFPLSSVQAQTTTAGATWTCSLDNIAATLTECQRAPSTDLRYSITNIVAQSTTATAGQFLLQYGTGTNCATGTTSLLPSAASVVRLAHPGNGVAPLVLAFNPPLVVPAGKAICALGVATNTLTIQMSGTLGF